MSLSLSSLLELGNGKSVRDVILSALGGEWPLTVQQLHHAVEQRGIGVSYHAVHKACQQLVSQGILKREKVGYLISMDWISRASQLLDDMKKNYVYNKPIFLRSLSDFKQDGDTQTFVFENLADADLYRKRLQKEYFSMPGSKRPFVSMLKHMRSPFLYSEKSLHITDIAMNSGIPGYSLIAGKTSLDEWCADYYRMQRRYIRTGIDCAQSCDTIVLGDVIVQTYISDSIIAKIDSIYNSSSDVSDVNIPEFYNNICLAKADVKVIVSHNTDVAEQLRNQIISRFSTDKVALFDLENTIVSGDFTINVIKHLMKSGLLNNDGSDMVKLFEMFMSGKISREELTIRTLKLFASAVKGQRADVMRSAICEFVKDNSFKLTFRYASKLFNFIRSYRKMVAITAFPEEFVHALESVFFFDDAICTQMEIKDGNYTGEFVRSLCTHHDREVAFHNWIKSKQFSLEGSIGFGDCNDDFIFLNVVALPIIINPVPELLNVARQKRWMIYDDANGEKAANRVRTLLNGGR